MTFILDNVVVLKDLTYSRTTGINWRLRLITSAAMENPTASRGAVVDCSNAVSGQLRSEAQRSGDIRC